MEMLELAKSLLKDAHACLDIVRLYRNLVAEGYSHSFDQMCREDPTAILILGDMGIEEGKDYYDLIVESDALHKRLAEKSLDRATVLFAERVSFCVEYGETVGLAEAIRQFHASSMNGMAIWIDDLENSE